MRENKIAMIMDKIKIVSCNANGLNASKKRRQVFKQLHELKADVIFLQETHFTKCKEKQIRNEWGSKIVYDHGDSNARGVATLFAKNFEVKIVNSIRSGTGRFLGTEIVNEERKILLMNVYAPNEDNSNFFVEVFDTVNGSNMDFKIVGGDLNTHLTKLDKKGGQAWKLSKTAKTINDFLDSNDWIDVWRTLHENEFRFTWKRVRPLTMSRLDYFVVPQHMLGFVEDCRIESSYLSDHSMVTLEISFIDTIRGKGYWKLNTALLLEKEYIDEVNKIMDGAKRYEKLNPLSKWEKIKNDFTEFSKYYSRQRAFKKNMAKEDLQRKQRTCEKKLACINLESKSAIKIIEKVNSRLDTIKKELQDISVQNISGTILRSKIRYYEEGEKNTKYFFALEKIERETRLCMQS